MKKNIVETVIGFLVIVVTVAFLIFASNISGKKMMDSNNYTVTADFDNVNGINIGSYVRLSGIKVGSVSNISLNTEDYTAIVTLNINSKYNIPHDSTLAITSASLLGGKFLTIIPGIDDINMEKNGEFLYTKSAVNLESLLVNFSKGSKK